MNTIASPTTPPAKSVLPNGDPFATRAGAASEEDKLANKETFLQLLVAQIKNQDPLNPSDGVQFLSQLAQFTQLEQTLGMRSDLSAIRAALDKTTASADGSGNRTGA